MRRRTNRPGPATRANPPAGPGKIITIANRKGGVGKTTLAVALGDALVSEKNFQQEGRGAVVLVDLDPQASASRILTTDAEFTSVSTSDQNLVGYIAQTLRPPAGATSADLPLLRMRHRITHRGSVEFAILPNSEHFWDLEAREMGVDGGAALDTAIGALLKRLTQDFDRVIVDCPPGQSVSATAAARYSDLIICPVTPDTLALWGMDLLRNYLRGIAGAPPPSFVIAQSHLVGGEANAAFERFRSAAAGAEPALIEHMLRIPERHPKYGDFGFAVFSRAEHVRMRTRLIIADHTQSLHQMYGNLLAHELRALQRAIELKVSPNG